MGTTKLLLGGVDYFFKPLSLEDFDETGRAIAERKQFSICEEYFGVSIEYLLIPGAIEPDINSAPQEYWPALIEEFKRINPVSVALTLTMKELVTQQMKEKLVEATEKELDLQNG